MATGKEIETRGHIIGSGDGQGDPLELEVATYGIAPLAHQHNEVIHPR